MKKRVAVLLLALAVLALLAGRAAGQKGEAKEPVPEPDTTARTLIRAIGKNQQVAYRFHTELVNTWDDGEIDFRRTPSGIESPGGGLRFSSLQQNLALLWLHSYSIPVKSKKEIILF